MNWEVWVEPDADMCTHQQPPAFFYILAPQMHTVLVMETLNLWPQDCSKALFLERCFSLPNNKVAVISAGV